MKISPVSLSYSAPKIQQRQTKVTSNAVSTHVSKPSFGSATGAQWAAAMRRYNIQVPAYESAYTESGSLLDMIDRRNCETSAEAATDAAKLQKNLNEVFSNATIKNDKLKESNIGSLRQIGKNNAYTGSMRDAAVNMDEVKKMGIKRIVSFCLPSETNIEQACKENNIDFHYFYVPQIFEYNQSENGRKAIASKMKGSFAKVVEAVKKGDCIIGCESGNQRTGIMTAILSFLDPKSSLSVPEKAIPEESKYFASIILQSMTDKEKAALGLTKDYGAKIAKMIKNYI